MIYVPDLENYDCFVIQNSDTIRAYEHKPTVQGNYNYRDFYINSHYMYRDGTQNFSSIAIYPTCIESSRLTDDFYYRNDFDGICLIFACFFIVITMLCSWVLKSFFRGWFK